jgi:hypothetical protein
VKQPVGGVNDLGNANFSLGTPFLWKYFPFLPRSKQNAKKEVAMQCVAGTLLMRLVICLGDFHVQ